MQNHIPTNTLNMIDEETADNCVDGIPLEEAVETAGNAMHQLPHNNADTTTIQRLPDLVDTANIELVGSLAKQSQAES